MKKLLSQLFVAAAIVTSIAYAGDASKSEKDKALKSVSCPPECGFTCKSRDEKELVEVIKQHAQKCHNVTLTDDQVKKMIKAEPEPMPARTMAD